MDHRNVGYGFGYMTDLEQSCLAEGLGKSIVDSPGGLAFSCPRSSFRQVRDHDRGCRPFHCPVPGPARKPPLSLDGDVDPSAHTSQQIEKQPPVEISFVVPGGV